MNISIFLTVSGRDNKTEGQDQRTGDIIQRTGRQTEWTDTEIHSLGETVQRKGMEFETTCIKCPVYIKLSSLY